MHAIPMSTGRSLQKQQGIATILVVVLVGVAMTASALGIFHSMKSTQQKQVAVHAYTNAQASAWTGVEAFRRYLLNLDDAAITALDGATSVNIGLSAMYGQLTANSVAVTHLGGTEYRIDAVINSVHSAAKSSAALGTTFIVNTQSTAGPATLSASLDFYDDLNIGGQITFNMPSGTRPDINVDGAVTMRNVNITRLGNVNSTSSVTLASQVEADAIYANGDVELDQGALASKVSTLGNFVNSGGGYATIVWANGNITQGASGTDIAGYTSTSLNAIGNINLNSGRHDLVKAGGAVFISTSGTVDDVQAVGSIDFNQWGVYSSLKSEASVACVSEHYNQPTSIQANGGVSNCPLAADASDPSNPVDITVMEPLTPYTMQRFVVDVWTLKNQANFVVEWDAPNSATKVTVYNIAGVENNSEYYLADQSDSGKSHLCNVVPTKSHGSATCPSGEETEIAMCLGHSISNTCLTYDTRNGGSWTVDGTASAPGVMWFDGNVTISSGMNYTTFLAAGDIATSGALNLKSVNYAGYSPVCAGDAPEIINGNLPLHTNYYDLFAEQYPTNFCDTDSTTFKPNSVGNIGVAAGGFPPDAANSYEGGNITLDALNRIYGSVLAGSLLTTRGDTTVYGYITSAALNESDSSSGNNELGGSTTIDLMNYPGTYDPTEVPDMSADPGATVSEDDRAKVRWTRYL